MQKRAGWIIYGISVAALAVAALWGANGLARPDYAAWSWYHYWFGTKYHQELGYFDMYEQTLAGWKDAGVDLGVKADHIRDLRSYQVDAVTPGQGACVRNELWTDARWSEFQTDLRTMRPAMVQRSWKNAVRDRGYNGSPTWTTLAEAVFSRLDLARPWTRTLLKAVDIVPMFALALLLPFVFGPWRSLACMAAFAAMPPNPSRFLGTLIQYDWFALVLLAAVAARKDRFGATGALLGVATAFRVFPAVFFLGIAARGVLSWWTEGSRPPWMTRLAMGFGLALLASVLIGSMGPRGPESWGEWRDKLAVHTHHHKAGDGRVGLTHLFTHPSPPWTTPGETSYRERLQHIEDSKWPRRALQGMVLALLAAAAWRRDPFDCFVLALGALFVGTVASRYYWSVLALLPLLGARRGDARLGWLGLAMAATPILAWYAFLDGLPGKWASWRALNAVLLGVFTLGLAAVAWDNFFGSRGTAAPEPKLPESTG